MGAIWPARRPRRARLAGEGPPRLTGATVCHPPCEWSRMQPAHGGGPRGAGRRLDKREAAWWQERHPLEPGAQPGEKGRPDPRAHRRERGGHHQGDRPGPRRPPQAPQREAQDVSQALPHRGQPRTLHPPPSKPSTVHSLPSTLRLLSSTSAQRSASLGADPDPEHKPRLPPPPLAPTPTLTLTLTLTLGRSPPRSSCKPTRPSAQNRPPQSTMN